ncbi:MAG: hypothetical protein L3J84_12160, partial [Gammaproteobacteria bacterium]|nr:hypothetical protein [Gammaproteobacteria bacterium]
PLLITKISQVACVFGFANQVQFLFILSDDDSAGLVGANENTHLELDEEFTVKLVHSSRQLAWVNSFSISVIIFNVVVQRFACIQHGQKTIEFLDPVIHGHCNPSYCLSLSKNQILSSSIVQCLKLFRIQIATCNLHILLSDLATVPTRVNPWLLLLLSASI